MNLSFNLSLRGELESLSYNFELELGLEIELELELELKYSVESGAAVSLRGDERTKSGRAAPLF